MIFHRTIAPLVKPAKSSGRIIRYRFSTPEVARDQHTIAAWKLDNFRQNPVFLWAHSTKDPPIGRVIELSDNKGFLDGSVEYAERDVYPFADVIFQLVRGGYINAVSTSWDPIEEIFDRPIAARRDRFSAR
jgi:Escherichia/Staphylococcus phage prohead protease